MKKRSILIYVWLLVLLVTACASPSTQQDTRQAATAGQTEATAQQDTQQTEETATTGGQTGELTVHYLDVGQGDATLIVCDGHAMLIDAGNNDKGTLVQSYLQYQKLDTLDYVVATHPDADHIGGLDVILTKFDCKTILMTDEKKDTATYRDVVAAMKYKSYTRTEPRVGDTYALGSAQFTIVAPDKTAEESNDNSIALRLTFGDNSFYFEGDAGEEEETAILSSGQELASDVYKIGHHGSKTSTSASMLEAVSPEYAVISVGENSYGHPSAEVLNRLRQAGVKVFRTDEQGTIVAASDGKTIRFSLSPSETWQAGEASQPETVQQTEDSLQANTEIVYVTKTGKKYHRQGCSYLHGNGIEVTLQEALDRGLTPCSRCY